MNAPAEFPSPDMFLTPVKTWRSGYGTVFEYVADDHQLIAASVVLPEELPGPKRGSFNRRSNIVTSRLSDGRCRAKVSGQRSARLDGGFQAFMADVVAVPQRDQGALAFLQALLDLRKLTGDFVCTSGNYEPQRFMPAFMNAIGSHPNDEWATGFWDAFGVWLSQTLEGTEIFLETWDVLRDLTNEGDEL